MSGTNLLRVLITGCEMLLKSRYCMKMHIQMENTRDHPILLWTQHILICLV